MPLTHAWFVQGTGELHMPLPLQVSTPLPEHWTAPLEHMPEHTPLTHVAPEHGTAVPH
jgi:hypothetical protein